MTPLTRADIAHYRDMPYDRPSTVVRNLATTAIDALDYVTRLQDAQRDDGKMLRGLIAERDTAEARCRALEEGLREVVSVLVEEQNYEQSDLSYDHLQNCRRAALSKLQASRERWRALLSERDDLGRGGAPE